MGSIQIKNLTYSYPDQEQPALKEVSLDIRPGEFVLLIGGSGSGKSTLMRTVAGLAPFFYGGEIRGLVGINGTELNVMDRQLLVQRVGMVFQDPESQLVMTTPENEVAFGLENIGMPRELIRRRIMEVASALSFDDYRNNFIPELSGGQKQKVALASVLAMHPEILLLDEPTSQLDPIAGEDILTMIRRLNEENGITIILSEQKLERCYHFADRIIVMEEGRIIRDSRDAGEIARWSVANDKPFVPSLSRIFAALGHDRIPVTIKEGRQILTEDFDMKLLDIDLFRSDQKSRGNIKGLHPTKKEKKVMDISVELQDIWFTYPNGIEVLKNVSLDLMPGNIAAVIGANGSGKTTMLKQINGLLRPGRGSVRIHGEDIHSKEVEDIATDVAYLSQDPNDYLFLPTVREEVAFSLKNKGLSDSDWVTEVMRKLKILGFADMNPRDLSVGERQRVAFASVLVTKPTVLLLDEPTRGLDYELKVQMGELMKALAREGTAILVVTHDIEFIAEYADEVVLMDQGTVIQQGTPMAMLANAAFYSPQVSRLFHNFAWNVVRVDQGIELLKPENRSLECTGDAYENI